ncbi:UNVERIFIED_CONTAM: hypothetical protein GTU68_028595 [Idotea baltica]|nr:hypothetical protein [Idotea baltica]
MMKKVMDLS